MCHFGNTPRRFWYRKMHLFGVVVQSWCNKWYFNRIVLIGGMHAYCRMDLQHMITWAFHMFQLRCHFFAVVDVCVCSAHRWLSGLKAQRECLNIAYNITLTKMQLKINIFITYFTKARIPILRDDDEKYPTPAGYEVNTFKRKTRVFSSRVLVVFNREQVRYLKHTSSK